MSTAMSTTTPPPRETDRSYARCLSLLGELASNRAVVSMVASSAEDMNKQAMPEMREWVRKAGYSLEDFNRLKAVHVAGTKGKGSVCAMVANILQQYGGLKASAALEHGESSLGRREGLGRIGLYTSPHLITPRERIRIDQVPISQETFAYYFFDLWDRFSAAAADAHHPNPTAAETKPGYFRYLTIMAFHVFLQEGIESAVIECGIGGEYDSTNILQKEAVTVSAITRLGIDHVGMLGDTIESIAWHKAGIFKEGVTALTVSQEVKAMEVLEARAKQIGCTLETVPRREEIEKGEVQLGLEGDFQKDNASLAIKASEAHLTRLEMGHLLENELPAAFVDALGTAHWEGRCEVRRKGSMVWCIDGAHTLDSLQSTAQWFSEKLKEEQGEGHAILIFNQQERNGPALLNALTGAIKLAVGTNRIFKQAIFCANNPFKQAAQDLTVQHTIAKAWQQSEPDCTQVVLSSVEEAMEFAESASEDAPKTLVLVTGSLHLVGGFLRVFEQATATD